MTTEASVMKRPHRQFGRKATNALAVSQTTGSKVGALHHREDIWGGFWVRQCRTIPKSDASPAACRIHPKCRSPQRPRVDGHFLAP
jgi:hypothetical protein